MGPRSMHSSRRRGLVVGAFSAASVMTDFHCRDAQAQGRQPKSLSGLAQTWYRIDVVAAVANNQVAYVLAGLARRGIDPQPIAAKIGFDLGMADEPGRRVRVIDVIRLLHQAEAATGDRLIGLHLGEEAMPRGLLAFLAMSQPTVEAALGTIARFAAHVSDLLRIRLTRHGAYGVVAVDWPPGDREWSRHAIDFSLAQFVACVRGMANPPVALAEVRLVHGSGGMAAHYERAFGTPVRFGQPSDAVVLPWREVQRPCLLASARVAKRLQEAIEQELSALRTPRQSADDAIRALMRQGQSPTRQAVARRLHTSVRSLQRRLIRTGTTFKALVERIRRDACMELLGDPALSLDEIASRLGFSDAAAFGKAFKRWTGAAPGAYRRRKISALSRGAS